mgnify:CR=1 FL=1
MGIYFSIGVAEGGSGGSEEPLPGRFKSRVKTQASASCRVCLEYMCMYMALHKEKNDQCNNVI